MSWFVATGVAKREETASARTLILDVPGWLGSEAGQHVDVRLTAPDDTMRFDPIRSRVPQSAIASN